MENSKISWTDHTMNFWIGCAKISDGCKHCYAEVDTFARKERAKGRELWGPKADRHRTSADNWKKPLTWNKDIWYECPSCHWRGSTKTIGVWQCPDCSTKLEYTRQRVFCQSLSDICEKHPKITESWRWEIAEIVEKCSNLDFLFLTKRIENFTYLWNDAFGGELPDNLWVGTTAENQEMADKRVPELMRINAKKHFLSCEPLLSHIGFNASTELRAAFEKIDWVIAGGESGSKARPMHPAWARSLRDQCAEAGIPFHFKQWGEWGEDPRAGYSTGTLICNGEPMFKVGKKNSGHLLDGVEHLEFPRTA